MFEVYKAIGKAAGNRASVLIKGESGTGRELVARAIHFNSILKEGPFVAVDCSGLSQDLLDLELFGQENGTFTGAIAKRVGKLELAKGGTLFFKDIESLSLPIQSKLLRVIEEKKIERIGRGESVEFDGRIIAATHRNLEEAVREGSFREDLYYRLNVVLISLPPLRERKDDIPLLVEHFLHRYPSESRGRIKYVPPKTLDLLMRYNWPGNVRELENVIERVVVVGKGDSILAQDVPPDIRKTSDLSYPTTSSGRLSLKKIQICP